MRFADISIRAKLLLAFALMLVAAVTMIATVYAELAGLSRTAQLNTQSKDIIRLTHVAEIGILRMNSQMRVVLLTGHYGYLDSYFEGRAQFDDGTHRLMAMPIDARQRAMMHAAWRKGMSWQNHYGAPLIRLARRPGGREEAARMLLAAGWRARVTYITRELAAVRGIEDARMQALQAAQDAAVRHAFVALGVGGVLLLSIAAGMSVLLARSIARPIHAMTATMTRLADGDYDTPISRLRRRDEIGRMADTLATFHANGVARTMLEAETRRLTAAADAERARIAAQDHARAEEDRLTLATVGEALALVARGDLTHRLHGRLPARALPLERDFDVAMAKLGQTLRGVRDAVLGLDDSAGQLSGMSEQLLARTDHQATRLTAMTRSIGGLKETVARNAGHARRAADVTATARDLAERSSAVMVDTRGAMDRLETNADRVSGVADVIGTISKQTGLLALNAMLEAARAGPAGAGFAVVAAEVKSLAARAETAAREIRAILATATADVATGVDLVRGCDAMLQGIIGEVVEVARLTGDIATTAQAQATEVGAVNTVAEQIDGMTREHAAMAIDTRACCVRLADEAQRLRDMVGWLAIDAAAPPRPATPMRAAA